MSLLNKRTELISKCRHENKFYLANFTSRQQWFYRIFISLARVAFEKTHKRDNPSHYILLRVQLLNNPLPLQNSTLSHFPRTLHIKDSTDIINRIQTLNAKCPFPVGSLLVSWDVVSKFPNIDNNLGITAVRKAYDSRFSKFPYTYCIVEAVNNCHFSKQHFVQKHGTAMGQKMCVVTQTQQAMGLTYEKAKLESSLKPLLWWRYIDDIFDLWPA